MYKRSYTFLREGEKMGANITKILDKLHNKYCYISKMLHTFIIRNNLFLLVEGIQTLLQNKHKTMHRRNENRIIT